jgi:plasmid stabilization system protein ParE
MAEYKLAQRARADLIDIYDFTEGRFGAYQAEAYHAGLVRSFGLLADFSTYRATDRRSGGRSSTIPLSIAPYLLHCAA